MPKAHELFTQRMFISAFYIDFFTLSFINSTSKHISWTIDIFNTNSRDGFIRFVWIGKTILRSNLNINYCGKNFLLVVINHTVVLISNKGIFETSLAIDFMAIGNSIKLLNVISCFTGGTKDFLVEIFTFK